MSDQRIPTTSSRPASFAEFRCPVCQSMTRSGEHGLCPRCGYRPPAAMPAPTRQRRAQDLGGHYWLGLALVSVALGLLAALAAVRI